MRKGIRLAGIGLVALTAAACHTAPVRSTDEPVTQAEIDSAIERAIMFIASTQDSFGEFQSTVCDKHGFCTVDSTPFLTTFVLYSLRGIRDPHVERMWKAGVRFLREEMLPGGLWRYWTFRAPAFVPILQPDLDDTVTAADILLLAGKLDVDNRELIRRNLDSRGHFQTWFLPNSHHLLEFDFNPAANLRNRDRAPAMYGPDRYERLLWWMRRIEFPNETDPAVNANVLMYLGEEPRQACDYLNVSAANRAPSVYYLTLPGQYYMYGRAYSRGISCISPSVAPIEKTLLELRHTDGSFGSPQETALALNTLEDFKYEGPELERSVRYLLLTQGSDGAWKDEFFFKESAFCVECRYWRSKAFTSALAVEALLKFKKR